MKSISSTVAVTQSNSGHEIPGTELCATHLGEFESHPPYARRAGAIGFVLYQLAIRG